MFLRIRPQNVIYNHYKRDEGQDGIYNEVNKEMVNLVLLNEGDSRIGRKIHQWFKGLTIICINSMVLRLLS